MNYNRIVDKIEIKGNNRAGFKRLVVGIKRISKLELNNIRYIMDERKSINNIKNIADLNKWAVYQTLMPFIIKELKNKTIL